MNEFYHPESVMQLICTPSTIDACSNSGNPLKYNVIARKIQNYCQYLIVTIKISLLLDS